jgi:hypothetical protein|tara:strand:+ start:260 stop:1132 length:873 start_codon:yes stop_codon:yes gene_type:complete
MNETVMAEEPKPQKKAAFVSRKYNNDEKRKLDEEELAELLKAQQGESVEEESKVEEEQEPTSAEEKTFKKRYSDLRRHQQKQADELKAKITDLERQLSEAARKEMKLPKSEEEIEAWTKEYPDVAGIVETIATKKAQEQSVALEERIKAIDALQISASKEKAEVELLKLHPDFSDIRESDSFHEWAEQQPKWVQDALYDNETDARSAARAIDLYKADMKMSAPKSKDKDAAKSVSVKNARSKPQEDATASYMKESDVQKMSSKEYEKRSDEIMEAIRSGKFIYDVSGSAR